MACRTWKGLALSALLALTLVGSPGCVSSSATDDEEGGWLSAFIVGLIFGDDDDDESTASCDRRKDKDTRHSGRRRP